MNSFSSPRKRFVPPITKASLLTTSILVVAAFTFAAHGQQAPAGNQAPVEKPAPATSPEEAQRRIDTYMAAPQVEAYYHPNPIPDYRAAIFDSEKFRLAEELVNSDDPAFFGILWKSYADMTEVDQAILAEAFSFCDDPVKQIAPPAWISNYAKSAYVRQRLNNSASFLMGCALDSPDPARAAAALKEAASMKKNGVATPALLEKLDRTTLSKLKSDYAPHDEIPTGDKEANRVLNGFLAAPPVNVGYYYMRSWNDSLDIEMSGKYAVLRRLIAADDPAVFARLQIAYLEMSEADQCMLAWGYRQAKNAAALLPRVGPLLGLIRFSKSGDAAQMMLDALGGLMDRALADPDPEKARRAADMAEHLYGLPGIQEKVQRARHIATADLAANESRSEASIQAMARAGRATTASDRAEELASAFMASYGMPASSHEEDAEEAMTAQLLGDLGRLATLLVATGDPVAMEAMWRSFPGLDWQHQCAFAHAVGVACKTDPVQTAKVIAALSQAEIKPAKLALVLAANGMLAAQLDLPAAKEEALRAARQLKETGLARPFLLEKLARIEAASGERK